MIDHSGHWGMYTSYMEWFKYASGIHYSLAPANVESRRATHTPQCLGIQIPPPDLQLLHATDLVDKRPSNISRPPTTVEPTR